MKVKFVVNDWQKKGFSIYESPLGIELSLGDLHHGTTFEGEINFDKDNEETIKSAFEHETLLVVSIIPKTEEETK